jgi:hypothetical protein
MSTQIAYAVQASALGTQTVTTVKNAIRNVPTGGGTGVPVDASFLQFWGLRVTSDTIGSSGSVVERDITLAMGPSSTATATIQLQGGTALPLISGITVTGQGLDYVLPPALVITDATGAGAQFGPIGLQVLNTAQTLSGGTSYVAPIATAVGGLFPGGVAATFSVTVVGGAITAVTCTNTTTNGPYAYPPTIVITDPSGSGTAIWYARAGIFPTIALLSQGTDGYTAPTASFTPYFKTLAPDSSASAQAAAVKGFMVGVIPAASFIPVVELAPVVS